MSEAWVVVVRDQMGVLSVLGPAETRIEADAMSQIVRCTGTETASVHRVRALTLQDVHGDGFNRECSALLRTMWERER